MNKISFREDEGQVIKRLRFLQVLHDKMLDQMFDEMVKKFHNKEISDRFWDAIPADMRAKYKSPIGNIRNKIRDIIKDYPQYYGNYKQQNKPYFQKMDKQQRQREELLKTLEESPLEQEEDNRVVEVRA